MHGKVKEKKLELSIKVSNFKEIEKVKKGKRKKVKTASFNSLFAFFPS